jgi:lactate permease
LVGFGYPWAFVAPILIALGIPDLDAIRVAAIANNAPVSYGALGAPIIALATVTAGTLGMSFSELLPIYSASVGKIVAILALLPPWILLYLVSGSKGMWSARSATSPDNCRPPFISGPICPMSSARSSAS